MLNMLLKKCLEEAKRFQDDNSPTHQKKKSQFGGWYDKTLNVRQDQSKSMISGDGTSRDNSVLENTLHQDSEILNGRDSEGKFIRYNV